MPDLVELVKETGQGRAPNGFRALNEAPGADAEVGSVLPLDGVVQGLLTALTRMPEE